MYSVFLDSKKEASLKNREILIDDFSNWELYDDEIKEEVSINKVNLNAFENLLLFSLYGIDITNDKNEITNRIKGVSMRKLSIETGIPYVTIYSTIQKIKEKLCKV